MDRRIDRQTGRQGGGQAGIRTDGQTDGRTDDGWMMDRWTDGQMNEGDGKLMYVISAGFYLVSSGGKQNGKSHGKFCHILLVKMTMVFLISEVYSGIAERNG